MRPIATKEKFEELSSRKETPAPELRLDPPVPTRDGSGDIQAQVEHLRGRLEGASQDLRRDERRGQLLDVARDGFNRAGDLLGRAHAGVQRAGLEWLDRVEAQRAHRVPDADERAEEAARYYEREYRDLVALMETTEPVETEIELKGRERSRGQGRER